MDKNNKTILVTGSSGFIGYNLCNRLFKELPDTIIIGIDNHNDYYDINIKIKRMKELSKYDNYQFIKCDISNRIELEHIFNTYNPNIVINLAGEVGVRNSFDNPNTYINTNIIGFRNIIDLCEKYKVDHLVYASSSSVYGNNNPYPFKETMNVNNQISLYAHTKRIDELMAIDSSQKTNMKTTGLRFFNVYGENGRPDMSYYKFTNKLVNHEKIELFNYGESLRDFTYIDDVVESICRVVNTPNISERKYNIYNIGSNNPIKIKNLLYILRDELIEASLLDKSYDIEQNIYYLDKQPGDVDITWANNNKFYHDYYYRPKTKIRDGMNKFVNWYKNND